MKDFENEFQRLLVENRMKTRHTDNQKIIFGLFNIFYLGYKNKYLYMNKFLPPLTQTVNYVLPKSISFLFYIISASSIVYFYIPVFRFYFKYIVIRIVINTYM